MASEILCDLIQPLLLDPTSTSKLLFHVFPSSSIPKLLHVCVLSHFSRVWLFLTPWIVAHQAPLSMRIPQARILEWLAISLSAEPSSGPLHVLCLLSEMSFPHIFLPLPLFLFFIFLFICSECCHTLKWNSHGFTWVPHPDPPSHLSLHLFPLGFPSAPGPSACLMHPTWAGDVFHPR